MGLLNLTEEQKEEMRQCRYELDDFLRDHEEMAGIATAIQMRVLSCILTVLKGD